MPQVQRLIDYLEQSLLELESVAGLSKSITKPVAKRKAAVKPKSKARAKA